MIDDALGDEVRVTVIAAGFDTGKPTFRKAETRQVPEPAPTASPSAATQPANGHPTVARPVSRGAMTVDELDDDLDIPEFLRS